MKRKLIKQGAGGCTVFLPIQWVRNNNLQPGDEISLETLGNQLVISSQINSLGKNIELTLDTNSEPYIRATLNNLYYLDYDKMTITCKTTEQVTHVKKVITSLFPGYEITNYSQNKITAERIINAILEKQPALLNKLFLIIKTSMNQLQTDMSYRFNNLALLQQYTTEYGRVDNLCRKNIFRRNFGMDKNHFYWGLHTYLLLIQHNLLHFYETLKANKTKISKNVKDIFDANVECFITLHEGYMKKNVEAIQRSNQSSNTRLYDKIHKTLVSDIGEDSLVLYYLGELSRLTYLATSPMLGILTPDISPKLN